MKKQKMVFILILVCSFLLGGCNNQKNNSNELKVLIHQKDPYVMADYIPKWSLVDSKAVNNSMTFNGFEIDLINSLAKKMGKNVSFINTPFNNLFSGIELKEADLAVGDISITDERSKMFLFSDPYVESGNCLVAFRGDTILKVNDLADKHVGVLVGTTSYDEAQKVKCAGVLSYTSEEEIYKALFNGDIDAIVMDKLEAKYDIKTKKVKRATIIESLSSEYAGILMNKENKDLREQVNKALKELKDSGEYQAIYDKWFN